VREVGISPGIDLPVRRPSAGAAAIAIIAAVCLFRFRLGVVSTQASPRQPGCCSISRPAALSTPSALPGPLTS
jgi:hypothetical protein